MVVFKNAVEQHFRINSLSIETTCYPIEDLLYEFLLTIQSSQSDTKSRWLECK
jgi:hypothetical protein